VIVFALTATAFIAAACDDPGLLNQSVGASIDKGNVIVHIVLCPGERVTFVRALEMRGEFIDKRDPVVWEISSGRGSAVSRIELGVLPDGFTEDEPYAMPTRDKNPLQVSFLTNIQTNVPPTVGFRMRVLKNKMIYTNEGYSDPSVFADRGAERCRL
jgi:hypothetical protein